MLIVMSPLIIIRDKMLVKLGFNEQGTSSVMYWREPPPTEEVIDGKERKNVDPTNEGFANDANQREEPPR
jgi:hypothetical protein